MTQQKPDFGRIAGDFFDAVVRYNAQRKSTTTEPAEDIKPEKVIPPVLLRELLALDFLKSLLHSSITSQNDVGYVTTLSFKYADEYLRLANELRHECDLEELGD